MKVTGSFVSERLGQICDDIGCERGVAGDCDGCPIDTAQKAVLWHQPFETEYEVETVSEEA
jgi:hypothetical protein